MVASAVVVAASDAQKAGSRSLRRSEALRSPLPEQNRSGQAARIFAPQTVHDREAIGRSQTLVWKLDRRRELLALVGVDRRLLETEKGTSYLPVQARFPWEVQRDHRKKLIGSLVLQRLIR